MPRKKKFARLLEDADIKRWYDNTARGLRVTADGACMRHFSFSLPEQLGVLDFADVFEASLCKARSIFECFCSFADVCVVLKVRELRVF